MRGWYKHSREHALAARGIRSRPVTVVARGDGVDGPKYYYRAMYQRTDTPGVIVPRKTIVERVDEDGNLMVNWITGRPSFKPMTTVTSAFSETLGGAIIGALSDPSGIEPGTLHIYRTTEKPDLDLTLEDVGDFVVIDEVRYNRPVEAEYMGEFVATRELADKLERAYGGREYTDEDVIERYVGDGLPPPTPDEVLDERKYQQWKLETEGWFAMDDLWLEEIRDELNKEVLG